MRSHPLVRITAGTGLCCVLMVTALVMPLVRSEDRLVTVPQYFAAQHVPAPQIPEPAPVLMQETAPAAETLPETTAFNDGLDLPQYIEGQFTMLFLGFDSQDNGSGSLHDVNYLLQFDLAPAGLRILQIPRDTYSPGDTSAKTQKFNSIYTCGDPALPGEQRVIQAVERRFGVPVDAYLITSCDDIAAIVDILGGVTLDMPYRIEFEADKIIEPGLQTLNGQQAAWLLRYRRGYAMGDIGRLEAQRLFIAALLQKLAAMPKLQTLAVMQRIMAADLVETDLGADDLARLADLCSTFGAAQTDIFLLPGTPADIDGQSLWLVDEQAAAELITAYFCKHSPQ